MNHFLSKKFNKNKLVLMIKNTIYVVIILENIEVLLIIFVISDRKHQKKLFK